MRLLTLGLVFISNICLGQFLQNGLILPQKIDKSEAFCVYSPIEGFTLYDNPNGMKIGLLTKMVESNTGDQAASRLFYVNNSTKKEKLIDVWTFTQIGYEIWAINYFERKNGFVRVIDKSLNLWINENEIIGEKFKITEWQEFLIDNSGKVLGFYANDPGINLRDSPSPNGKILKELVGDLLEIHPFRESNGLWTKVKVIKRIEEPCTGKLSDKENVEYTIEGWIKIVDDNGLPNLWYYPRGC
jgi:hypothetical protein